MDHCYPAPASPYDAAADSIQAADAERTDRHLRMLRELADLAMDFARRVHRSAQPAAAPPRSPQATAAAEQSALVFARVARCLRQTLALEARLAQDHRTRRTAAAAGAVQARAAARVQSGRRIRHGVIAALQADPAAPRTQSARYRLEECLTDIETDDDIASDRPIAEIIARICRVLRIVPPRTPDPRTPDPRTPDPRTPDPRTPDPRPTAPHPTSRHRAASPPARPDQGHHPPA